MSNINNDDENLQGKPSPYYMLTTFLSCNILIVSHLQNM